ncbi:MAG: hypothetical protein ACN4GW_12975 [Desulforhopalus sp.]
MIKAWYVHVREETMAPARMVSFMEQHVETCDICLQDPGVKEEIAKITEMVLPESKIPKAVRQQNQAAEDAKAEAEAEAEAETEGDQDDAESANDGIDDEEEEALDVDDELLPNSEDT